MLACLMIFQKKNKLKKPVVKESLSLGGFCKRFPSKHLLARVNNRNVRKACEIVSKSTKTSKRCQ